MDKTENKDIVSNEVTDSGEENDLVIKLKTPIDLKERSMRRLI